VAFTEYAFRVVAATVYGSAASQWTFITTLQDRQYCLYTIDLFFSVWNLFFLWNLELVDGWFCCHVLFRIVGTIVKL